ncbi:MAG: hypothetical protein ACE366_07475 [Bradymonadia bacterium]
MKCWRCGSEVDLGGGAFCGTCHALQAPAPDLDHFARLGLEPRFAYERSEIAASHRAQLRIFHPDLFHGEGAQAWSHAVAHATAINNAWRGLADPQQRFEYLLTLHGAQLPADSLDPSGMTAMDPIHRVEMAELDSALSELDGVDAHTERTGLGRQIAHRYARALEQSGQRLDAELAALKLDGQAAVWQAAVSRLRSLRALLVHLDAEFPFGVAAP